MQNVSDTYRSIVSGENYFYEAKLTIDGVEYTEADLISMKTSVSLFGNSNPAVGAAVAGSLSVKMLKPVVTPPRMARCEAWLRARNAESTSEWIRKGVFFIDTRSESKDGSVPVLQFTAYDAMMKAGAEYPSVSHQWPSTDADVIEDIASSIGVEIDERTAETMNKSYAVEFPGSFTMRETLALIGALYGGSFMMSDEGKLLLVTLGGLPRETNYLLASNAASADYITIGGDRILVEEAGDGTV